MDKNNRQVVRVICPHCGKISNAEVVRDFSNDREGEPFKKKNFKKRS